MEMSRRVQMLRGRIIDAQPEVCLERAWWMTESYKETEGQPEIVRRAKAFDKIMSEIDIRIDDGELIVGSPISKLRGGPVLPEIQWEWYLKEMDTISTRDWDRFAPLSPADKEKMRQFLPYWKGKALYDRWRAMCPADSLALVNVIAAGPANCIHDASLAHAGINGDMISRGLARVREDVKNELSKLNLALKDHFEKYLFLNAALISLDAVMKYARRHARLARDLAKNERDNQRKLELERIASICEWVPENPARNFHEALQAAWFLYVALITEAWGYGYGFARADQYLLPFYSKDMEEGRLTRDEARELIELLYIKLNALCTPHGDEVVKIFGGFAIWANFTLGGVTSEGRDAVNDLTYLFLEAEESVHLMSEDLVIRIHKSNPDRYVHRAVEVLKGLKGKFKFSGDEIAIQQLMRDGKPLEYARDYTMVGCITPTIPGFSQDLPGSLFNLPLMLELALNNGIWRLTGERIGVETGDANRFASYEDVWEAYKKQVEALIPITVMLRNADRKVYTEFCPTPFQSLMYASCIRKGIDVASGGTLPNASQGLMIAGAANVADSLSAIKKLVFDDKAATMERLAEALAGNFENDPVLLRLIGTCPKFGNDDDYVDTIMCDLVNHFVGEASKYHYFNGLKPTTGILTITSNIPLGSLVGALPDGRKAGAPFADGGISPCQGKNVSGPTSTMRSVSKIDHIKLSGGCALNMRFDPAALQNESKMKKFGQLIRTFFETGGSFVQFNIVDTETLRNAQRNPEQYKDLLVRVSTYSAYFVELSKELQDDIIARMEIKDL